MVAGRSARDIVGYFEWQRAIDAVDWQRVFIQSQGIHARYAPDIAGPAAHGHEGEATCGECIRAALLMEDQ